jgi:chemotaxis protein histidine kinase CheA
MSDLPNRDDTASLQAKAQNRANFASLHAALRANHDREQNIIEDQYERYMKEITVMTSEQLEEEWNSQEAKAAAEVVVKTASAATPSSSAPAKAAAVIAKTTTAATPSRSAPAKAAAVTTATPSSSALAKAAAFSTATPSSSAPAKAATVIAKTASAVVDTRDFTRFHELSSKVLKWKTEFDVVYHSEREGRGLTNLVPIQDGQVVHRYGGDRVSCAIGRNGKSFVREGDGASNQHCQNGEILYRPARVQKLFDKYPQLDRSLNHTRPANRRLNFHATHALQVGSQHPKNMKVHQLAPLCSLARFNICGCSGLGRHRWISDVRPLFRRRS